MNTLSKYALLLALGIFGVAVGSAATIALQGHAQTTTNAQETFTTATNDDTSSATAEITEPKTQGHAPLGGDGNISSINGTTIVMVEEADEGGASYTVNSSAATITKNGATAQLSDLKVGDKIFVQGTVNGTNVTATSISVGRPGGCSGSFKRANEANETNETN